MKANLRFWAMVLALAGATVGLHALSHGTPVLLSTPLNKFPLELGSWHSHDVTLDSEVLKVAAVDDYLNRVYQASDGRIIGLYVGYYKSQQTGDVIHSVNQTPIDSLTSLRAALRQIKPHDSVVLQVERGGGFDWLAFEME